MKFKKFVKESKDKKLTLALTEEWEGYPEKPTFEDDLDAMHDATRDFDRRCDKCNTLLNDGGTCPKCDDGEEDYEDLDESCKNYNVKKYGAYWFGIVSPDGSMLRDDTGKLRLFKNEADAQDYIETECQHLTEELTNSEKLKRAFPELNFNKETTESVLTEGVGSDTAHAIKDSMSKLAEDDTKQWAKTTADILDTIPDTFMDELFDMIKESLSDVKLTSSDKSDIINSLDDTVTEEGTANASTLGDILNAIDPTVWAKKNPKFIKDALIVILGIVALIEPTPVVEVITGIVMLIPENIIAKIVSILSVFNPITILNKQIQTEDLSVRAKLKAKYPELNFDVEQEAVTEELSNKEKLKAAYPELNFEDTTVTEDVEPENFEEDPYYDYDDDYDDLDDVELDRRHAALYGGDRMYCDCGAKLVMDEWGGYCPRCNPPDPEAVYVTDERFDDLDDSVDE